MANGAPGPEQLAKLAAMSRQAADLGGPVPASIEEEGRRQAELRLGMRCAGCGERIGVGLKFTRVDVVMSEGKPAIDVQVLAACNGANGCDYATKAQEGADVMEMVEFVWLHGGAPVSAGDLDADVAQAETAVGNGRPAPVAEGASFDEARRRARAAEDA